MSGLGNFWDYELANVLSALALSMRLSEEQSLNSTYTMFYDGYRAAICAVAAACGLTVIYNQTGDIQSIEVSK